MKTFRLLAFVTFCLLTAIGIQSANPPGVVNYQGVLRNPAGKALDGTYDMTFRFFDTAAAGNEIMLDEHKAAGAGAVTVSKGLFGVPLGSGNLVDGSATFCNDPYTTMVKMFQDFTDVWMQIEIGNGTQEVLLPRVKINSAPYALKPIEGKRWLIQDSQPAGTPPQCVTSMGEWLWKTFNTIVQDGGPEVALNGNIITFKPGKYQIRAVTPVKGLANSAMSRLYDMTHSSALVQSVQYATGDVMLDDIQEFVVQTDVRLEVWVQGCSFFDCGACSLGVTQNVYQEVFAQVVIEKLN